MAKKGGKVLRILVSWGLQEKRKKVGKTYKKVKEIATSRITKEAATALGIKEFKPGGTGTASAYKKTSNGATVANSAASGTIRGVKAYASVGGKTAKGNLKWFTIPVPQGTPLVAIHKVCTNVKYLKWKGGKSDAFKPKGKVA
jgi:hypothetical protein